MSWTEVLGFVAGVVSVVLYVRQSVWAWPTGIANSCFWLVLFWQHRLFLDAGLQVVYIVLGVLGWYWWIRGTRVDGARVGRERRADLPVTRVGPVHAAVLAAVGLSATAVLWPLMVLADDAAPLPDAATTVLALIAQYLLTRKLLATWWCWILVDVAYTVLYASRGLYLTAALQPLLLALCVIGLRQWRASILRRSTVDAETLSAVPA